MLLSKCQIFSIFAPENKLQIVPVDLRSVKNSSMRLRRDKQLLNNCGTLAKTTMKLLTGVAPAGRSQSFGSLKRVDEVNNLEQLFNNPLTTMKKILLLLALLTGTLAAHSQDYAWLTFQTTDGTKISVPASSLTITISGTSLTAGSQTFVLSNLSKMYFSDDNQSTGVSTLTADELDGTSEIYDLNGRKVSTANLSKGVYIVKSKNGTCKIAQK